MESNKNSEVLNNHGGMAQAPPAIIRLEHISKLYGSGDTEIKALADVNLTIERGEYCAIMGPSGSGKSTVMNIIGCLDRPTSGHYALDEIGRASCRERV